MTSEYIKTYSSNLTIPEYIKIVDDTATCLLDPELVVAKLQTAPAVYQGETYYAPAQIIYLALHQDYSEDAVYSDEVPSPHKCEEVIIRRLLNFGHYGPLEHVQFIFNVVGFPHEVPVQYRTQRFFSFDVQSQRYTGSRIVRLVDEVNQLIADYFLDSGDAMPDDDLYDLEFFMIQDLVRLKELERTQTLIDTSFTPLEKNSLFATESLEWQNNFINCMSQVFYIDPTIVLCDRQGHKKSEQWVDRYAKAVHHWIAARQYVREVKSGEPMETSRRILSQGIRQHFVMSGNLRAFMHLFGMRSAANVQFTTRIATYMIAELFRSELPLISEWMDQNLMGKNVLAP